MSEDCLTVNVFRPKYTPLEPSFPGFPVLVYVHGGDFSSGTSGAKLYDGDFLSSRGHVIVVTFNYRLGMSSNMPVHGAKYRAVDLFHPFVNTGLYLLYEVRPK